MILKLRKTIDKEVVRHIGGGVRVPELESRIGLSGGGAESDKVKDIERV